MTGWFVSAWSQPVYYSYGTGGNVYYEDNTVYVDGNEYCSADEYYTQAEAIATDVPQYTEEQAEQEEWMPLGVWAITTEGAEDSNRLIQLAVNKDGVIAGNYFNETTDTDLPLEGSVDRDSQRAAWHVADEKNNHIVMETGIYNLTESAATALLHYGKDKTQEVALVRLDQPEDEGEQ